MQPTPQHREIEVRFLELLTQNELPLPDDMDFEPGTVWFIWHLPKVAIAVDFEPDEEAVEGDAALSGPAGSAPAGRSQRSVS